MAGSPSNLCFRLFRAETFLRELEHLQHLSVLYAILDFPFAENYLFELILLSAQSYHGKVFSAVRSACRKQMKRIGTRIHLVDNINPLMKRHMTVQPVRKQIFGAPERSPNKDSAVQEMYLKVYCILRCLVDYCDEQVLPR